MADSEASSPDEVDDADSPPLKRPRSEQAEQPEDGTDDDGAERGGEENKDDDGEYVAEDEDDEGDDDEIEGGEGATKARPAARTTTSAARARHSAWEERLRTEVGWMTREAEDAWIGKRVRDMYGRYTTTVPGETPRKIAAAQDVDLAELLRINVKRWYETLVASSWVEAGTRFFLPASKGDAQAPYTDGKIVGVNEMSQVWHIRFDDGDECDLGYDEVSLAIWNARLVDEEWKTDPKDNELLGMRVRRPFGYGFAKGRIVAYLPEGNLDEEEYEMWHVIHDHDGDHEDLEKGEIEVARKAWEDYTQAELARKSDGKEDSKGSGGGVEADGAALDAGSGEGEAAAGGAEGGQQAPAADAGAAEGGGDGGRPSFEEGENVLADNAGTIYPAKILQIVPAQDGAAGGEGGGASTGEDKEASKEDTEQESPSASSSSSNSAASATTKLLYLVHYQGWKKRFDEWLQVEHIYKSEDPVALARLEQQRAAKAAAKSGIGQQLALTVQGGMYDRLKKEMALVGDEGRVLVLPRSPTVVQIMQQWLEISHEPQQQVNAVAVVTWLRAYFEVALPTVLLYEGERWQLAEIRDAQSISKINTQYGEIYGAEHLLRLLVKLPAMVAAEETDSGVASTGGDDRKELERMLASLMKFLEDNEARLFSTGAYQDQAQRLA
jgi:mortality factor 4-like protein 1